MAATQMIALPSRTVHCVTPEISAEASDPTPRRVLMGPLGESVIPNKINDNTARTVERGSTWASRPTATTQKSSHIGSYPAIVNPACAGRSSGTILPRRR